MLKIQIPSFAANLISGSRILFLCLSLMTNGQSGLEIPKCCLCYILKGHLLTLCSITRVDPLRKSTVPVFLSQYSPSLHRKYDHVTFSNLLSRDIQSIVKLVITWHEHCQTCGLMTYRRSEMYPSSSCHIFEHHFCKLKLSLFIFLISRPILNCKREIIYITELRVNQKL